MMAHFSLPCNMAYAYITHKKGIWRNSMASSYHIMYELLACHTQGIWEIFFVVMEFHYFHIIWFLYPDMNCLNSLYATFKISKLLFLVAWFWVLEQEKVTLLCKVKKNTGCAVRKILCINHKNWARVICCCCCYWCKEKKP